MSLADMKLKQMNADWTHDQAVELCRTIALFAPFYGCHVALTGGTLYKNDPRKDCDILFYRIRQAPSIDKDGLFAALAGVGLKIEANFGFVCKATYETEHMTQAVDIFFPDSQYGGPLWDEAKAKEYQ